MVRKENALGKIRRQENKKLPKKKSQIAHLPGLRLFSFLFTNSKRVFLFFLIRKASLDALVKKKCAVDMLSNMRSLAKEYL